MLWKKEKITTRLDEIIKEVNSSSSEEQRYLKIGYSAYIDMLRLFDEDLANLYRNKYYPSESYLELHSPITSSFRTDSFEDILNMKDRLCDIYNATTYTRLSSSPMIYKSKASEEAFLGIVEDFFKGFSKPMYELFLRLLKGNVFISNKKYKDEKAKGLCFHENECYVTSIYKSIRDAQTLPHEVAHAYQIENMHSKKDILCYHFSTYREAFPRFLELAFIHENIDGPFRKCLLAKEREFYDSLIMLTDYYVGELHHITDYDLEKESFNTLYNPICKETINDILSRTLAMYFYSIYVVDKEECFKLLRLFNENVGHVYDSVITSMFLTDDAVKSIKKVIGRYPLH